MSFDSIVPAAYKSLSQSDVAEMAKMQAKNGRISVQGNRILIAWDRDCPCFNVNLVNCRELKSKGYGSYYPNDGGWLFSFAAKETILTLFDACNYLIDPAVFTVKEVSQQSTNLHGEISFLNKQYVVSWTTQISRDTFNRYLTAAKTIKATFLGCRGYNPHNKCWQFAPEAAWEIVKAFPEPHFQHSDQLLTDAEKAKNKPTYEETVIPDADIEAHVMQCLDAATDILDGCLADGRIPYKHQKEAVKWMLECRMRTAHGNRLRGCILADEMGLGKTVSAAIVLKAHKEVSGCKTVVIAPNALQGNWKREAAGVGIKIDSLTTNHVASFPDDMEGPFVVVVDEAHDFQDFSSGRTRKLLHLCGRNNCEAVYLLTGTPLKNGRPYNLKPLLLAINHGLVGDRLKNEHYLYHFCGARTVYIPGQGSVTTFNGADNLQELHREMEPAILRRLQKDCVDVPPLVRNQHRAELTSAQQAAYDETFRRMQAEYRRRVALDQISSNDRLVLIQQLRVAGSVAKAHYVNSILPDILEEGHAVAIFTAYRESAEIIASQHGIEAYTGDLSNTRRQKLVDDFQNGKVPVFVGTGKAAGTGLNLHANGNARTVILNDRPWTPGDAEQWEKRLHRIGQTGTVQSLWIQHGIIDDTVDNLLITKKQNSEEVLTGQRNSIQFGEDEVGAAVIDALGWN